MDTLTTVKQAIQALSIPSQTKAANEWLTSFEKSSDVWTIAPILLEEPPSPNNVSLQFFAVKFLYSKISKQFYELTNNNNNDNSNNNPSNPNEQADKLLLYLLNKLIYFSTNSSTVDYQIIRYISLSISGIIIQIYKNNIIQDILLYCNPILQSSPGSVLVLLTVLPEEVVNTHIHASTDCRDALLVQLAHSSKVSYIDR
jgi:hypothetical protein